MGKHTHKNIVFLTSRISTELISYTKIFLSFLDINITVKINKTIFDSVLGPRHLSILHDFLTEVEKWKDSKIYNQEIFVWTRYIHFSSKKEKNKWNALLCWCLVWRGHWGQMLRSQSSKLIFFKVIKFYVTEIDILFYWQL